MIMGASYGSLLASKVLFGGHSVHLICLPAEADLINSEGFRVRMPIRGRKDPVVINSRKLPGKVTAGGTDQRQARRLRSGRPRHAGAAVPLARRARAARCGRQVGRALHVDHEHAAARLHAAPARPRRRDAEARLHRSQRVGQFRSRARHAVQPRPAGDPPAGREGQRAAGHPADQLQGRAVQGPARPTRCSPSSRRTSTRCASTRRRARSSCR